MKRNQPARYIKNEQDEGTVYEWKLYVGSYLLMRTGAEAVKKMYM